MRVCQVGKKNRINIKSTFCALTFGVFTFGETTFGEFTYGEMTFDETTFGELTFGEFSTMPDSDNDNSCDYALSILPDVG